jgi:hypothetical protein
MTIMKEIFLNIFLLLCMVADLGTAYRNVRIIRVLSQHMSPAEPDSNFSVAEIATLSPDVVGDPGPTASSSLSFTLVPGYQLHGTSG